MSRISILNPQDKYCSQCRCHRNEDLFFRKGKLWKTCNICSEASTAKRHAETQDARAGYGTGEYNDLVQRIAVLPIGSQESNDLMAQQLAFLQQQQHFFEQYWHQLRLLYPKMTLDYLMYDQIQCEPSPLEQAEEYYRQHFQTVQLFNPEDFVASADDPWANYSWTDSCPVTRQRATGEDGFDSDLEKKIRSGVAGMDYEESIKQHVINGFGSHSFEDSGMMDVNNEFNVDEIHTIRVQEAATQTQQEATDQAHASIPDKRVRQRLLPFNLDPYFADFNPSEDLLRQPASPKHDLTGEDLAKHQICELGLALRLSLLPKHWHGTKQTNWYKQIEKLDCLEESGQITAWGPLSDWLVMYENGLESILEAYPIGTELNPKMAYKVRAAKAALFRSLRESMRDEAQRLFLENKEALLKFFVERSGQAQESVRLALDRQVRRMKNAIEQDCAVHGILGP